MRVQLIGVENNMCAASASTALVGVTVSGIHRVRHLDDTSQATSAPNGVFVFSDLSVRFDGCFRLRFDLFGLYSYVLSPRVIYRLRMCLNLLRY